MAGRLPHGRGTFEAAVLLRDRDHPPGTVRIRQTEHGAGRPAIGERADIGRIDAGGEPGRPVTACARRRSNRGSRDAREVAPWWIGQADIQPGSARLRSSFPLKRRGSKRGRERRC